ncbi:hypothetical protein FACS189461_0490 [Spirochaetia bacterium]|nr:hypothetical protein FACS189461_0490 [Spirochaetia bacterium]
MKFTNLEQRMAKAYIDMFPGFVPDEIAPASIHDQEQFYLLMKNLYRLAFDEPLLFVSSLHEDDAYPSRYKKPYGKPKLILDMKKFLIQKRLLLDRRNTIIMYKPCYFWFVYTKWFKKYLDNFVPRINSKSMPVLCAGKI